MEGQPSPSEVWHRSWVLTPGSRTGGKTVSNYAEGLSAFCDWCVQRDDLEQGPLKGLAPFDTTPQTVRRAMAVDEINRLLVVGPTHRRFLYETAFLSGLRANELRNLTVDDLDVERCGLRLGAEWTKNKKDWISAVASRLGRAPKVFRRDGGGGAYITN
ncbi:MAG: site-specific recombinase XerC [Planctomycetota bacterium]